MEAKIVEQEKVADPKIGLVIKFGEGVEFEFKCKPVDGSTSTDLLNILALATFPPMVRVDIVNLG